MLSFLFSLFSLALMVALLSLAYIALKKLTGIRMPVIGSEKLNERAAPGNVGEARTATPFVDPLTFRAILIALLAVLMLLPLQFVDDVVSERGNRHQEVLDDIARTWGQQQILTGPVLVLPFTEATVVEEEIMDKDDNVRTVKKTVRRQSSAQLLPSSLSIDVQLQDELRQRSLFRSLVYNADITLDARFDPVRIESLSDSIETIHWNEAWLSMGLSDTRAINEVSTFTWNEEKIKLSPGTRLDELASGFHAVLPDLNDSNEYTLAMSMSTKGSGLFQFTPFGETTKVTMHSTWPHPSFQGSALPNSHDISDTGFSANWEIPHLARNYPQAWHSDLTQNLFEFTAGVSMYQTVSLYSQITRAVKYGLLFIGLSFLTLFIFEVALDQPLHAVQYALVGIALSVFYLVLLALSEHLNFLRSYACAAVLTILMISIYTAAVLRSRKRGLGIFVLLTCLYSVLYSLLQLEDYALLLGTALLVLIIAVLMLVTRNLHRLNSDKQQALAGNSV